MISLACPWAVVRESRLKVEVDFAVGGDGGVIDEGVPGLVAVFEGRLGGEVVADFDGLGSAVTQVVDLISDALVLGLELVVSVFEFVVAAVVVVRVMDRGCCGGDELVHQRDGFFEPLSQCGLLGFELAGVVDGGDCCTVR